MVLICLDYTSDIRFIAWYFFQVQCIGYNFVLFWVLLYSFSSYNLCSHNATKYLHDLQWLLVTNSKPQDCIIFRNSLIRSPNIGLRVTWNAKIRSSLEKSGGLTLSFSEEEPAVPSQGELCHGGPHTDLLPPQPPPPQLSPPHSSPHAPPAVLSQTQTLRKHNETRTGPGTWPGGTLHHLREGLKNISSVT